MPHHVIDGILELKNLTLDIDRDKLGEHAFGDTLGDARDFAHLRREVVGHFVDAEREILPDTFHIRNVGLSTKTTKRADFERHAHYFTGKNT